VRERPAFPAPSDFFGASGIQNPGVVTPREGGDVATFLLEAGPSRRGLLAAPQDEAGPHQETPAKPHGEEARSAVSNHEARK
jgi:hypothetical protein